MKPINFLEHHGSPIKPFGKCESNGYYSDSKNCAAYYICKNGLSYHLSCGSNLMFNPENGRCDHVDPQRCRPGETIYIESNLKDVGISLKNGQFKDARPKVYCKLIHYKMLSFFKITIYYRLYVI